MKSNAKKTTFRFPFDIDNRVFLLLALLFLVLSFKSVQNVFIPGITLTSLKKKIEKDVDNKITVFKNDIDKQSIQLLVPFNMKHDLKGNGEDDPPYDYFIFKGDSLVYWSTNTILIERDTFKYEIPFAFTSSNGNYVAYKSLLKRSDSLNAIALIKVKNNFQYASNHFKSFYTVLNDDHDHGVELIERMTSNKSEELITIKKHSIYQMAVVDDSMLNYNTNVWRLFLHCLPFIFFGISIHTYFKVTVKKRGEIKTFLLLLGTVLLVRGLNYLLGLPDDFRNEKLFSPDLFATDWLNCSLGDTFINMALLFWILVFFVINVQSKVFDTANKKIKYIFGAFVLVCLSFFAVYASNLIFELINDSTVNYDISNFSHLDSYSFIGILVFQLIFSNLVVATIISVNYLNKIYRTYYIKYIILSVTYLFYYFLFNPAYDVCYYYAFLSIGVLFLMLDTKFFITKFDFNSYNLLLWFILISFSGAATLTKFIVEKEKNTRLDYAKKLAYYEDQSIELKLESIRSEIKEDSNVVLLTVNASTFDYLNFSDLFYDKFIRTDLSSYKCEYSVYDSSGLNRKLGMSENLENSIGVIRKNYFVETMDSVYAYRNTIEQGYYFVAKINNDNGNFNFILCRFYRPLMFEREDFVEMLQADPKSYQLRESNYSTALYDNNSLVLRKGLFSFSQIYRQSTNKEIFFTNENGYSVLHYAPKDIQFKVLVAKEQNWFYLFTTLFAMLFFSIFTTISLYILGNIIARSNLDWKRFVNLLSLNLRLRIHVAILLVVFFSFVAVGIFTSFYLNNDVSERLRTEISNAGLQMQNRISDYLIKNKIDQLRADSNSQRQQFVISEIEDIISRYKIKVNLYDSHSGDLLYTTNSELLHLGLMSKMINPIALYELNAGNKEQLLVNEKIADKSFLNSYTYLKNGDGKVAGILHIPFMSIATTIKYETGSIVIALINIYVFVFLFSAILAFFITKRVTQQFTYIVKQFTKINLTKTNQPLTWNNSDEIGLLVKEYNRMLRKLENTTVQLAKNERELAWREMAKQVAHEIKNPLTPMKLSLQMLERAIKNNASNIKEMTDKVTTTLIEQIDNLSIIATNFSNFAKMPELNREDFNLNDVLRSVTGMYNDDSSNEFLFIIPDYPIVVNADKSQLIRVFTNLIQNAIQAVPTDKKGNISLEIQKIKNNFVRIVVSDNGVGIPLETQSKLFTPYFTTKSSGTGLGLAMCKDIVEGCGGRVSFETQVGAGTSFFVELPIISSDEI